MSTFTPESTEELFAEQSLGREHTQSAADLTGRDRLVSNVLFNWGAHSVFIVAGFIMPRMIDRRLGQQLLGVWEFSWSLVNYFGLIRAAIGSSVNRYVARHWAARDISSVNHIVSSASCILGLGGLLVMGLTIAFSFVLTQLFSSKLGDNVAEAQWVVLFLGASLSVQISFGALSGVLTGCHRWGLHNINTGGWYAATVGGMIVTLLLGGRLWTLAAVTLAGEVLASTGRLILAHRVCQGLRLRPSLVQWQTIKKLFSFGGKTLLPSVSNLLLNQTTSILIVAYLGPAALALYNRPRSVMYHVQTLVGKMAMTLTPTTSSLQSAGNVVEIRELAIKSARYSFYMALPMVLMLTVFGGSLMQLWMGPRYADGLVPALLATGHMAILVHWPALCILGGLNAHGRAGAARFVASVCSVGLNILVLAYLKWGLVGTAVAVTLPLTLVSVVDIPLLICRRVGLDVKRYFCSVAAGPLLHTLPFAVCLVGARLVFQANPLLGLGVGGATGGAVLAVLYWRYVIPDQIKTRLVRWTGVRGSIA